METLPVAIALKKTQVYTIQLSWVPNSLSTHIGFKVIVISHQIFKLLYYRYVLLYIDQFPCYLVFLFCLLLLSIVWIFFLSCKFQWLLCYCYLNMTIKSTNIQEVDSVADVAPTVLLCRTQFSLHGYTKAVSKTKLLWLIS